MDLSYHVGAEKGASSLEEQLLLPVSVPSPQLIDLLISVCFETGSRLCGPGGL